MTLTSDIQSAVQSDIQDASDAVSARTGSSYDKRPVEFWPTAAIRAALDSDDLSVWQRIATAIKRDPYGRTARQVEEVLETVQPYGVCKAMAEVLSLCRKQLEATERAEVARHVQMLLDRSGLGEHEFAYRIGVPGDQFDQYLAGTVSPPASLIIRMRRLSDRFAKMRAQQTGESG